MDHQPFLRAIRAQPEDDLRRLVYADALEESGASERAEFIRVQVALANTVEHDPQFRVLEDREHELLGKNERTWMGNPTVTPQEWAWHRGFVDEVMTEERHLMSLSDCLKDQVVTNLDITYPINNEVSVELPIKEWSRDLRSLTIRGQTNSIRWRNALESQNSQLSKISLIGVPAEVAFNMLRFSCLRNTLQSFELNIPHGNGAYELDRELCDTNDLAELFEQGHLRELRLTSTESSLDLGLQQLRILLASTAVRNLSTLDFSYTPIGPEAYRAFESCFAQFESIGISGTPLAGISLRPLLESRCTQTLKSLEVDGSGSARTNLEAVANSRFWSQAERFSASQGTIQASTFEALTKSGSKNLRHLELGRNYLRTEGMRYLCEAHWADSLTYLSLWNNYLDDESCDVMAKSGRFKNLRTLNLSQNHSAHSEPDGEQITDRGIIELCKSAGLANLRLLALGHLDIGDAAVEAIFNAPFTLSAFHLNATQITDRTITMLAQNPKLARLNTLDLSDNVDLDEKALTLLAYSPYLSPLCELSLAGYWSDSEVVPIFRERLGRRFTA